MNWSDELPVEKKILEKIEKLLRLAAPRNNPNEPERISAALEAARLIEENDLVVRPRETKRRAIRQPKPPVVPSWPAQAWSPYASSPPPGWARSIAARDSFCADPDCGGTIYRGDKVWAKITGFDVSYIHLGGDCGW